RHTRCYRDWSSDVCSSDLHLEAQPVVLHVGAHAWVALNYAAELALPVAVQDEPVDVASRWIRLPAQRFGRGEVDVRGGVGGVIEIGRASGRERVERLGDGG